MRRSVHIHTFYRPSGFRVVARGIHEALRRFGIPSFAYYGDVFSVAMVWLSGCARGEDLVVPVWHFGRAVASIISGAPVKIAMYTFVEGDPIVDHVPKESCPAGAYALAPNSYVASKIARYFGSTYVVTPPMPEEVARYSELLVKSIRMSCRDKDAVLCYVANNVPRKGWHYLKPVLEALVREQGIKPCFVAVTNADIDSVYVDGARIIRIGLGGTCTDEVVASAIRASDVYVSLSTNEGFGVPIALALLLGRIPVSVAAPSIVDTFGGLRIVTFPYRRVETAEWLGEEVVEMYVYDPSDAARAIARALDERERVVEGEIIMEARRVFVVDAQREIARKIEDLLSR